MMLVVPILVSGPKDALTVKTPTITLEGKDEQLLNRQFNNVHRIVCPNSLVRYTLRPTVIVVVNLDDGTRRTVAELLKHGILLAVSTRRSLLRRPFTQFVYRLHNRVAILERLCDLEQGHEPRRRTHV